MLAKFRSHLSYSRVVATLALFVALGGSSFAAPARDAASKLISGKRIKNNSIASADIKNNSIRSGDVRNRSLLAKDFKAGQLPAGPQGAPGPAGGTGRLTYVAKNTTVPADTFNSVQALCPIGQYPTGGSADIESYIGDPAELTVNQQRPDVDEPPPGGTGRAGWAVIVDNDSDTASATIRVQAICAVGPVPTVIEL